MSQHYVALLRGINVGRAKRVAMAELRAVVERLGYGDVRTLLNSGNVVFTATGRTAATAATRIEHAVAEQLGVRSRITVLSAAELSAALSEHPLRAVADDPSRLMIAVPATAADRGRLKRLLARDWSPDALAIGSRVAFLWCADGILASPLMVEVARLLGDGVTCRNWATMSKLHALIEAPRR